MAEKHPQFLFSRLVSGWVDHTLPADASQPVLFF